MTDRVTIPEVPPVVGRVAAACSAAGGRAWLVGGGVRDHLMGRAVKDWDIEVYHLAPEALQAILERLGHVSLVGRSFGVLKLTADGLELDVSLPRRDSLAGPGHRGIAVEGDPEMPPAEAARRRDLTINAMLLDPLTGELLDPWSGRADLEAGLLRAVDADTFLDDPLRALRVVQFAGRLGFAVDPTLAALCRRAALDELPRERILEEWRKLLLRGRHAAHGLAVARDTAVLQRVFPEAAAADHPDVDRALSRLVGHRATPAGRNLAIRLAAWLHRCDPAAAEATLDRLGLHRWGGYAVRDRCLEAVACWPQDPRSDAALRILSTRCELHATLTARWAVSGDGTALDALERARELGIAHAAPTALVYGRHLLGIGIPAGPRLGQALAHVYQLQLLGEVTTRGEAVAAARRWWATEGDSAP